MDLMYLCRAGTYAVRGLSTSITVLLVIAGERRERRKRNTEITERERNDKRSKRTEEGNKHKQRTGGNTCR
jgi:hypothetical protein